MKKILSLLVLTITLFSITPISANSWDDNYFVVTAYYSPLPDQKHYLTGNYEDEMILNGRWIAGASGKPVFSWMLAAPKKYGFGTKIYLKGLGVWTVEDRGGAIVPAGMRGYSYDRIDVWMGYGDEGLRRALYWGKRKVYWHVVSSNTKSDLDYSIIPSPLWATNWLKKQITKKKQIQTSIFDVSLGKGSDSQKILELQDILKELKYYSEETPTGEYDNTTIDAVYDFQIQYKIVSSELQAWAGSYGPKTRTKLKEVYNAYLEEKREQEEFLNTIAQMREDALTKAEKHVASIEKPLYWEISPRVRELQKTLKTLGYFEYKDTAIFGVKTKNSLLEYQIAHEIINDSVEVGAGTFGPKTRAQFTIDLQKVHFTAMLEESNLKEKYMEHTQDLDNSVAQEESVNDIGFMNIAQVM